MANGDAFDDAAAQWARETPSLDVGCHLVLVRGPSVADPSRALPAGQSPNCAGVLRRKIPVYEKLLAQVRN